MRKQNSGRIVNISSGYALCGGEQCAHYASAKAGVIGLTTSIAREAAPFNINCNVIVVPTTDTPGLREADGEFVDDELPLIPKGRIAKPLDIANAVLYLVSEASDYVTGQILSLIHISTMATNTKVTMTDDGKVRPYAFRACLNDPQSGTILGQYTVETVSYTHLDVYKRQSASGFASAIFSALT